jgi:hypothetical protein
MVEVVLRGLLRRARQRSSFSASIPHADIGSSMAAL